MISRIRHPAHGAATYLGRPPGRICPIRRPAHGVATDSAWSPGSTSSLFIVNYRHRNERLIFLFVRLVMLEKNKKTNFLIHLGLVETFVVRLRNIRLGIELFNPV